MFIGLMCLFALAIVVVLIKQVYNASQKKKEEAAKAAGEVFYKEPSNPARLFSKFYNSAIWSMLLTLVCSNVPKITGAVNVGWIYLGLWLCLFAITALFRKFKCGTILTAFSTVASLAGIYLLCGSPAAFGRKPAGIVRMGLGLRTVSMTTFNIIFAAFIVFGFIILALLWKRQKGIDAASREEYERLKAEANTEAETQTA